MPRAAKNPPSAKNASRPEAPLTTQATGQSYGTRGRQEAAMDAIPLPDNRPATGPASADTTLADALAYQAPSIGLGRPTDFPNRSITEGLDGPSAPMSLPTGPNVDALALAQHLPMLETLASNPNASATTRALVRRLRSALPPDFQFDQGDAG